ncbi:MAG: hypothetical protein HYX38_21445 [Rhodospirillales bacterium]|nr:hypothetical protein [Rhodospirillales bacterium]
MADRLDHTRIKRSPAFDVKPDDAILEFIARAAKGDALPCCFYAIQHISDRGYDAASGGQAGMSRRYL